MFIDRVTARLLSDEALDLLAHVGGHVHTKTHADGRPWQLLLEEPCVFCQHLRDQHFERSAYNIGYYSSFLDPGDLSFHCAFQAAPIPCPASRPDGISRELWLPAYLADDLGAVIDRIERGA